MTLKRPGRARTMMFSSHVCARSVMHEPSAERPCQLKTPSSWLQVMTVPRRTMSTCRARRQGEPSTQVGKQVIQQARKKGTKRLSDHATKRQRDQATKRHSDQASNLSSQKVSKPARNRASGQAGKRASGQAGKRPGI
jgi:hypothetical protein